ncbi:hypothetical protein EMIT0324P_20716 [Pseudomonas chlororaphis]
MVRYISSRATRDLLDRGQEQLVQHPNSGCEWLMENGYRILDEEVAQEKRFNYEINVADAPGR